MHRLFIMALPILLLPELKADTDLHKARRRRTTKMHPILHIAVAFTAQASFVGCVPFGLLGII